MNQRLGPIAISSGLLVALVLASCWLRLDALTYKSCLERDESTSYLVAAAKLGAFADNTLTNRWVAASEWSAHHRIDEPFAFGLIRHDLIAHDIHPPLYFWLLHLAGLVDGELGLTTGGRLNLALHVCALVLLFAFAWQTGHQLAVALLAVALWTFSPPVIATSLLARQYELMSLLAIASFASLSALMESQRRRPLAALGLASSLLLAALSHYQALLLVPALGIVALAHAALHLRQAGGRDRAMQALGWAAGAVLAALALYFVVQPEAWSEARAEVRTHGATLAWASNRSSTIWRTLGGFSAGLPGSTSWLVAAATAGLAFTALVVRRALRSANTDRDVEALRAQLYSFLPMLLLALPIFLLYASMQTARHAMGARYLALVWPFLALWLAQPLRLTARMRAVPLLFATALALLFGLAGAGTRLLPLASQCWPLDLHLVEHYDAVVLNTTRKGRLATFFPHWSGDTQVFAASGMALFDHKDQLLDGLAKHPEALIFHLRDSGVARDSRSRLLELLADNGYELGPPDDPSVLIRPNTTALLLVAPGAEWSPGLLQWARDVGADPPARVDQAYALLAAGGEVLDEVTGTSRSLVITAEVIGEGATHIEGTIVARANPDRPASLRVEVGGETVLQGPGSLAIAVLDTSSGEVLARRIARPGRSWKARRASFRVWQTPGDPTGDRARAEQLGSGATLSPPDETPREAEERSLGEEQP